MNSFWTGKKVLITGITGLIGSWLAKSLIKKGACVVGLIRDNDPQSELIRSGDIKFVKVVSGCLEDYKTVERAINENGTDTVFHLGAQTIVSVANIAPLQTYESNIKGTYNLLEVCRIHNGLVKRIVIASSDKAYGDSDKLPYYEDHPLVGKHPYDVSKSCADLISQAYWHTYGLNVVIARCGNVYGGGDLNWSRIVPGTIYSAFFGERPVIRSDGKYVRDYVYVKDIADAYTLLAEKAEEKLISGEAFNFSNEIQITVSDIAELVLKVMNKGNLKPVVLNEVSNEIVHQYLSSEKARLKLGWKPAYTIEEGLKETVLWYTDFLKGKNL